MKKSSGARKLSAQGLRFGIVVSRFNSSITEKLLTGALKTLKEQGARLPTVVWVPGAFEIPLALQKLARQRRYHALISLGAVVRGETPHFDYICKEAARGVMKVMLREELPIAFGILTTNSVKQALERAGGRRGNKGSEAALTAIEMARLNKGR